MKNYYTNYREKSFPDEKQLITYSFNEEEQTIIGIMEEKDNFIYLYEYRGELIGNDFFISFSKQSSSYRLIKVTEITT
jgi:hypothetical protein